MRKRLFFSICSTLMFFVLSGFNPIWAVTQNFKEITAPEVKSMLDSGQVVVINLMSNIEFEMQHIPGSINIPFVEFKTSSILPKDKNQAMILHCMGEQWHFTPKAAGFAVEMGYTDVYAFRRGIPGWRSFNYPMNVNEKMMNTKVKKLSPTKVTELLKASPPPFLLDVRPRNFPKQTYIEGTTRIDLPDLPERLSELPRDRDIIITDAFFKQSPLAAKYLINNNFHVIGTLKGGMKRWMAEDLPFIDLKNQ